MTMPVLKESGNLRYPMAAQLRRQEGVVRLRLFISEEGTVLRTRLMQSSGFAALDNAATQYASALTFHPATRNGVPEPALIAWRVRFEIADVSHQAMAYVEEVNRIYTMVKQNPSVASAYAGRALEMHESFATASTDAVAINEFIRLVVLPETYADYVSIWSACPLRFTLFDDFLRRFPGVETKRAEDLLQRLAAEDMAYAASLCFPTATPKGRIDAVSHTIRRVLQHRYPDLDVGPL